MGWRGRGAGNSRTAVLFDGSVLADGPMDGIRRYTRELLRAMGPLLKASRRSFEVDVCLDGHQIRPLAHVVRQLDQYPDAPLSARPRGPAVIPATRTQRFVARMRRSLAKRLARPHPDYRLLHLPLPNTWALYRHQTMPLVVTVHDLCHLVCPELQDVRNCRTLDQGLAFARQRDAELIAVSESTRRDLTELTPITGDRIRVIPEACDRQRFAPVTDSARMRAVCRKYGIPDHPWFFSLCTLEPRKNLVRVVEAFRRWEATDAGRGSRLVLAGRAGWGEQQQLLRQSGDDRVLLIGHVADDDLPVLFSAATAFVCMSHYEGFCLPLLEAMSCGCPVIHSDRSAMPEVAGGAGLMADPQSTDAIAACLHQVATDATRRDRMRRDGLQQAARFSWQQAAAAVLALYERLLAEHQLPGDSDPGTASPRRAAA